MYLLYPKLAVFTPLHPGTPIVFLTPTTPMIVSYADSNRAVIHLLIFSCILVCPYLNKVSEFLLIPERPLIHSDLGCVVPTISVTKLPLNHIIFHLQFM